jgi:hypothetical protein
MGDEARTKTAVLLASGRSVEGSFSILRFAEPDLSDVVYLEQLTSALYLDNPEDVTTNLSA